jgi:hypothetical protein
MWTVQRVGAGLVVLGCATAVLAAGWVSPFGHKHVNSSTCNDEACVRHCRICCLHFHQDLASQEWIDCNNSCNDASVNCPNETDRR